MDAACAWGKLEYDSVLAGEDATVCARQAGAAALCGRLDPGDLHAHLLRFA
jgi:hypothetical protein